MGDVLKSLDASLGRGANEMEKIKCKNNEPLTRPMDTAGILKSV